MASVPPVVSFAVAYGVGVTIGINGAPLGWAPLFLVGSLLAPISLFRRPGRNTKGSDRLTLVAVLSLGWVAVQDPGGASTPELCAPAKVDAPTVLRGRLIASLRYGSAPFELEEGCGTATAVGPESLHHLPAGRRLVAQATWREGRRRPWIQLRAAEVIEDIGARSDGPITRLRWALVRWRDHLAARLDRLYGAQAPLVAAIVLARREGLDSGVRDAFASTGIAHLLAISGFHVGVIVGLVVAVLRRLGVDRRRSALRATLVGWGYVAVIGFPDAACRAALILTLVAVARIRGRPSSRWSALASAALILLVLDPQRIDRPGFQLSFAGAAGLTAWARPWVERLQTRLATLGRTSVRVERLSESRVIRRGLVPALGAGLAATVATFPVVAWHFERISSVGIPMTLVATPLVATALPGALTSLALDHVSPQTAQFLSGGVSVLLAGLTWVTRVVASWPHASLWVTRTTVAVGMVGCAVALMIARAPRIGGATRRLLVVVYGAGALVAWPMVSALEARGTLEIVMIDVGQGDAIAIRTPRNRWLLIDAGPPAAGVGRFPPAVQALRTRGVRRLELLVLTHPDLDHIGGAAAILENLRVARVLDPAQPAPKAAYRALLERAQAEAVPWTSARAAERIELDDVTLTVLHPSESAASVGAASPLAPLLESSNAASVVLLLEWGDFEALFTGDAYADVERSVMTRAGDVDLLKVGHHGSDTSSDSLFLAVTRPEIALISVGRRNRYGHPTSAVLGRLEAAGAAVYRTDRDGTVRILVDRNGSAQLRLERSP